MCPPPNPMALYPTIRLPEVGDETNAAGSRHSAPHPPGSPQPQLRAPSSPNDAPGDGVFEENERLPERKQRSCEDRQREDGLRQEDATPTQVDRVLMPPNEQHISLDWFVTNGDIGDIEVVATKTFEDLAYIGIDWQKRPATYPETSEMVIFSAELGYFCVDARPYVQIQDVLSAIGERARKMLDTPGQANPAPPSTASGSGSSRGINGQDRQEETNRSQGRANWSGGGSVLFSESDRLASVASEAPESPEGRPLPKGWKWGGLRRSQAGEEWVLQLDNVSGE